MRESQIKVVDTFPCRNDSKLDSGGELFRFVNHFIGLGYEGIMLRNSDGSYKRKRSPDLLKWKPQGEDDYKIVGYTEEVSIEGEPKDSLGALTCIGDEEDGEPFNVGTGPCLTRDARISLWRDKEQLIGKRAVVKYQHLTKYGVPRFPVLLDIVDEG